MRQKRLARKRIKLAELLRIWRTDATLGSYTGTPKDGKEPTQDADDL